MAYKTVTKTCNKIRQSTGNEYAQFNDLNNLRLHSNNYAQTKLIKPKSQSPNTPAIVLCEDFRFNIPSGARVREIRVLYEQMKLGAGNEANVKQPNIGAPTIILRGDLPINNATRKGVSPDIIPLSETLVWAEKINLNASYINSANFGVQLRYPANSNDNQGYLRLYNVRIQVSYVEPEFEMSLNKTKGEYNGDEYEITAKFTNKQPTSIIPMVTINVPPGFTLTSYNCKGKFEKRSSAVLIWMPGIYGVSSDTLTLKFDTNVTFSQGSTVYNAFFDMSEAVNNGYKSLTVPVKKVPEQEEEAGEDDVIVDDPTTTPTKRLKLRINQSYIQVFTPEDYYWFDGVAIKDKNGNDISSYFDIEYGDYSFSITPNAFQTSECIMELSFHDEDYEESKKYVYLNIVKPNITEEVVMIRLSDEEKHRLGHGYTYIASTVLKTTINEAYLRDWDTTFRIGIFNEAIETNITTHTYIDDDGEEQELIIDTTDYNNLSFNDMKPYIVWGNPPAEVQTYTQLTCEFRYNHDYPLWIIITSDDKNSNLTDIKFTTPQIVESNVYHGREATGHYPVPIHEIVKSNPSELTLPANDTGTGIVLYNIPFPENLDDNALIGITINGYLDRSDDAMISATITSPTGETRTKTIVINDDTEMFTLGGYGDLWGFSTRDLTNVEDWEIVLTVSNPSESTIYLNIHSIETEFDIIEIDKSNIKIYIDGEDLSHYGIFLKDVKVPEGLKTDVDYLTVHGTDTNKAYLQTIQEKTLEIEFDIGQACDITDNTSALRRLTKLLVNRRDKYNKPILKRIEFSHYPDVYWEYLMKDTLDNDLDISDYEVKAKLIVPSGTSYSKIPSTTSTTGFVDGLVHTLPAILIQPYSENITIRETISNQEFNIGYSNYEGKLIELDCGNRKAYLKEHEADDTPIDITRYVDINSDWFRLLESYEFETIGCNLLKINYIEKW